MTVVDSSAVVDLLLGVGVADEVKELMNGGGELAAPDVLTFEVLAVLRRETLRGTITEDRASGAMDDLGNLPVELFTSMSLRWRAWSMKHNLTTADALFAALAERLGEPLATKDGALATALAEHTDVTVYELTGVVDEAK